MVDSSNDFGDLKQQQQQRVKPISAWGVFKHTGKSAASSIQTIKDPLKRFFLFLAIIAIASETSRQQRNHDERILSLIARQKRALTALKSYEEADEIAKQRSLLDAPRKLISSASYFVTTPYRWIVPTNKNKNTNLEVTKYASSNINNTLPAHLQSHIKLTQDEIDKLDEKRKESYTWY